MIQNSKDNDTAVSKTGDDLFKGILFMLLSACGFAIMNLFVRLSGNIPTMQKSLFRNLIAFFVAGFFYFLSYKKSKRHKMSWKLINDGSENESGVTGKWDFLKSKDIFFFPLLLLVLRSSFGLIGILANFYSIDHIPVAEASLFNKTAPFFMIIFSFFILNERIKPYQIISLLFAFAGVIIISFGNIKSSASYNYQSYLIALMGGMSAALAYTFVRILGKKNVNPNLIICFFSGFSFFGILPIVISNYQSMSLNQYLLLIAAGIGASMGQYGITFAYKYAAAKDISIFDYSTIIFTAILSAVFLGELPSLYTCIGAIFIFSAALFVFIIQKRRKKIA